eukprot:1141463-Pelagomonas_calceolata.AAC.10
MPEGYRQQGLGSFLEPAPSLKEQQQQKAEAEFEGSRFFRKPSFKEQCGVHITGLLNSILSKSVGDCEPCRSPHSSVQPVHTMLTL